MLISDILTIYQLASPIVPSLGIQRHLLQVLEPQVRQLLRAHLTLMQKDQDHLLLLEQVPVLELVQLKHCLFMLLKVTEVNLSQVLQQQEMEQQLLLSKIQVINHLPLVLVVVEVVEVLVVQVVNSLNLKPSGE